MTGITSCRVAAAGSVKPLGGVDQPGIDVLAQSSQYKPEEPAVTASGAGLEKQKVVLFALDRAFGAGAGIEVCLPEVAFSRNEGVQPIVLLGIGVDHAAIG